VFVLRSSLRSLRAPRATGSSRRRRSPRPRYHRSQHNPYSTGYQRSRTAHADEKKRPAAALTCSRSRQRVDETSSSRSPSVRSRVGAKLDSRPRRSRRRATDAPLFRPSRDARLELDRAGSSRTRPTSATRCSSSELLKTCERISNAPTRRREEEERAARSSRAQAPSMHRSLSATGEQSRDAQEFSRTRRASKPRACRSTRRDEALREGGRESRREEARREKPTKEAGKPQAPRSSRSREKPARSREKPAPRSPHRTGALRRSVNPLRAATERSTCVRLDTSSWRRRPLRCSRATLLLRREREPVSRRADRLTRSSSRGGAREVVLHDSQRNEDCTFQRAGAACAVFP